MNKATFLEKIKTEDKTGAIKRYITEVATVNKKITFAFLDGMLMAMVDKKPDVTPDTKAFYSDIKSEHPIEHTYNLKSLLDKHFV